MTTARPVLSPLHVDVGALTHPGHVRPNNEDHFLVTRADARTGNNAHQSPRRRCAQRADEVNYVMVVADGMGGHAAGEVASRLAISALVSLALDMPDWIFRVDEEHAPRSSGGPVKSCNRSARC